jgi:hypothetical protein
MDDPGDAALWIACITLRTAWRNFVRASASDLRDGSTSIHAGAA